MAGCVKVRGSWVVVQHHYRQLWTPAAAAKLIRCLARILHREELRACSYSYTAGYTLLSLASTQVPGAGTVLVVEDEELVRRSLYDILEGNGYRVLQARNAREAMLIGRGYGGAIDLMLTDLVLPGMNGPELADELRPLRPGMQVLYISGYRDDVRVRRLEQVGKVVFPKPFSAAAIAEKVSGVLAATPQSPGRAS